jgi:cell division protein FtsN
MATSSSARKRRSGPGWLLSLLGAAILICSGCLVGLVMGVVRQEPELVVGHVAGRGEEVPWSGLPEADSTRPPPDVAAPPPPQPLPESPSASGGGPADSSGARPAVSAPPPPGALGRPAEPGYSVQVGAFSKNAVAKELAGSLRGKGFPAFVTPAPRSGDQRWRVRVGPMRSKGEADRIARRLKVEERLPTWVLNRGGS